MKRLIFFAVALTISASVYAQDDQKEDVTTLKSQANEFIKVQDYKSALPLFTKIIDLQEANGITDTAYYFKAAVSAQKSGDNELVAKYFGKCVELNLKKETAYQYMGVALQNSEKFDELKTAMQAGLQEYPNNVTIKKLLAVAYVQDGKAEYEEAAAMIKAAEPLKSDVEKYNAEIVKAKDVMKEALPEMEKAYELDPANTAAKQVLISIYTNLGMSAKANALKK